jgi:hypothetical protein
MSRVLLAPTLVLAVAAPTVTLVLSAPGLYDLYVSC